MFCSRILSIIIYECFVDSIKSWLNFFGDFCFRVLWKDLNALSFYVSQTKQVI